VNLAKQKYRIVHIIGTRPHYMKLAPIYYAIKGDKTFDQSIIHTGQHYDPELTDRFLSEFGLPKPDYNLEVGSMPHLPLIGTILLKIDEVISNVKPDMIYVYGDTNSTVAGAIAASKRNIPLAHIEAGLREFDKSIPEEVNKLLIDSVADLLFCPTQTAVDNLGETQLSGEVHLVGDVVVDLLKRGRRSVKHSPLEKYGVFKGDYYFATCHRAANTDDENHLTQIISAFEMLDQPVIFPIHFRTSAAIDEFDLYYLQEADNIIDIEPVSFWETQRLIAHAKCVITDSGGVIREAHIHKTPCVIIDKQTEWVESVDSGWAVIAGPDTLQILDAVSTFEVPTTHSEIFGDGKASERILDITKKFFENNIEE
jgi:UDP-N-acetylglucosamine 2-epimerase